MSLSLALQFPEQFPLLWNLHHLVIHDAVHVRNRGEEGEQVGGNVIPVDGSGEIRPNERGQVDDIHIDEVHRFHNAVTQVQVFVRTLDVLHGERSFLEVEGHEAMKVLIHLLTVQLAVLDTPFRQDVHHLAHLHMEVLPHLRVVFDKGAFDGLLCDDEIGRYFRIRPALIISEIAL